MFFKHIESLLTVFSLQHLTPFSLYIAFQNSATVDAAEKQSEAYKFAADDSILQLRISIAEAYHAVLSSVSDAASYLETKSVTSNRLSETASRVRIGRSRPSDLYTAQAQLAASEAQVEQSRAAEQTARQQLAQLSGLPSESEITDTIPLPNSLEPVDAFIASLESSPAVRQLSTQINATESQISAARSLRLPDLDFVSNYYIHRDTPLDKVKWDAGLQLSWSIFDSGLISGKIREASSQKQIYDIQLARTKRLSEIKIRQSHAQLSAAFRQIPLLKTSWSLAQKVMRPLSVTTSWGLPRSLILYSHQTRSLTRSARITAKSSARKLLMPLFN